MNDYLAGRYESVPMTYRAIRYDGHNHQEIEKLLTAECTLTIPAATTPVLLLRRPGLPDHLIQVGDWVTVDEHLAVGVSSNDAFLRRTRRI